MIGLYGITGRPAPVVPGLRAITSGELAAVCGEPFPVSPTAEDLWRHEQIVERLAEHADVLPVRYGTRLDDEEAVGRVLDARREELGRALDRIRGAAELSLRIAGAGARESAPPGNAGGAAYLRAKIRAARARGDPVLGVHAPLARIARASVERAPGEPGELLRAAYLVDRASVPAFTAAVAALQREHPALRLLCTGPWPPYSFVGG